MISIIVYGRNDNHGYNLQKRVALSLNCYAEAVRHYPDAEIIFVDWCSDRRSSPLLISLYDLLSETAKSLTNIVRVSPDLAAKHLPISSYLHLIEPIARNLGSLYAKNNWILHTTTDIILATKPQPSSFSFNDLSAGYYALPRFELPEVMWEYLSRTSASESVKSVSNLADIYNLRTSVLSTEQNLFDAPGDFQLVDRNTFHAVGGFDETMNKGWHVDSNFAYRCSLYLKNLPNPCLTNYFESYHMNHNRKPTQQVSNYSTSNSLVKYVRNVRHYDWRLERKPQTIFAQELFSETTLQPLRELHNLAYQSLFISNRCQNQPAEVINPRAKDQPGYFDVTLYAGLTEALNPLPSGSHVHVFSLHSHQLISDLQHISAQNHHLISSDSVLQAADYPAKLLVIDLRPSKSMSTLSETLNHFQPVFRHLSTFLSTAKHGSIFQVTLINCESNIFDQLFTHHISLNSNMYFLRCKTGVYIHKARSSKLYSYLYSYILIQLVQLAFRLSGRDSAPLRSGFLGLLASLLGPLPYQTPVRDLLSSLYKKYIRSATLSEKIYAFGRLAGSC